MYSYVVSYASISSLPKRSVLSFILCFAMENFFFVVTFVNANYFMFIMKTVFFLYMCILFVCFGFCYFHSVKIQSNNYLYVKYIVFLFQMLMLT